MRLSGLLRTVMGAAARRPLLVGLAVGLLALAGGVLALRLEPTAATDPLVGRGSASFAATERLHQRFGDEAVYVLVREPVTQLTLTSDILRVQGLEGCISGNAPKDRVPPGGKVGPCAQLARTKPAKVVFGPGTFLNEAIGQIQDQFASETKAADAKVKRASIAARALARAQHKSPAQVRKLGEQAKQIVQAEFAKTLIALALKYGIRSAPQLNDPQFVSQIVFDDTKGPGVPRAASPTSSPTRRRALIQVRISSDLSESERARAIGAHPRRGAMPDWQLPNGKGDYVVTGAPVVVDDLTGRSAARSSPSRRRARGHGAHAGARLPRAPAAAAARRRPRGRGAHLRRAVARRRVADDGLDRGAARAHRPRGRLRHPAAVARPGGAGGRGRRSGGGRAHGAARRPYGGDRRRATAAGFVVLALSPVPWCAASGCCSWSASRLRSACAVTLGRGRARGSARRRPPPRAALERARPAWRGAARAARGQPRGARRAPRAAPRAGRGALRLATGHPGRVLARRAGHRGRGLGARHADAASSRT